MKLKLQQEKLYTEGKLQIVLAITNWIALNNSNEQFCFQNKIISPGWQEEINFLLHKFYFYNSCCKYGKHTFGAMLAGRLLHACLEIVLFDVKELEEWNSIFKKVLAKESNSANIIFYLISQCLDIYPQDMYYLIMNALLKIREHGREAKFSL